MNTKMTLPKPYDLLSYDCIYIILKSDSTWLDSNKELTLYDHKKRKHYITGKLIVKQRLDTKKETLIKYPRYRTISIIHSESIKKYENIKNDEQQESLIMSIPYSEIEYIIAPFDSLDWVK